MYDTSQRGLGGAGAQGVGLGSPIKPQPILDTHLSQIEARLGNLGLLVEQVNCASLRIMNERPVPIGEAKPPHQEVHGQTIEGRLQGCLRMLERHCNALNNAAQALDSAV